MGRENLSGIAVVVLSVLALSACSQTSNSTGQSGDVTVVPAKQTIEDQNLAVEIQLTSKLPHALSKNFATGLQFKGNELQSGHRFMANPPKRPAKKVRVDVIATPSHQRMIRVQMSYAKLRDVFGETEASHRRKKVIWLEDVKSQHWFSIGYMLKKSDGGLYVNIDRSGLKQGKNLPMKDIRQDDELYLFFAVSPDSRIDQFNIGDAELRHTMMLDLPLARAK